MLRKSKEYDDGALQEYRLIDELETDADTVHKSAVARISGGSLFGGIGEDLLDTMEKDCRHRR